MARHNWNYKTTENGKFWVVCEDCGASDKILDTDVEARKRIFELKYMPKSTTLARLFPKKHF